MTTETESLRALAREVDCMTPAEMRELAGGITPLTEEAWLKRGVGGPPSVLFGKQRLYPIGHLKAWLHAKLSERHPAYSPKDFL